GASAVLASADYANQGTTTTLLHGNAAGNPSWSAVNLGTDTTGLLSYTNISGLTDTQTNAMLNSPRFAAIVSNNVVIAAGATNILGWVTNLAGVDWTIVNSTVTNSMGYWSTNGPSLLYSFDGVTWNPGSGSLVTNVPVEIGFYSGSMASNPPTMQIPLPGYVTNVTAWQLTRPDLFGRTNSTYGIHMQASDPVYPQDVATMAYVNNLFAFTPWWSAQQDVQLNGFYINLSSAWQEATTVTTNTAAYHLRFLGQDMLTVNSPNPASVLISSVTTTNSTNVVVKVATNGLPVAPWLELSHYILPAQWNMLTNRPTIISTNYVWTFVRPYTDEGFLLAVVPSTNAPAIQVSGTLDLMPFSTVSTNMGALRIWNSNNAALYTRGTNGVDKLLLVWP
ncbi:MAG TPA: hypothetical protein VMQ76_13075, partial [Terracidiphilus sp.]|nr:hypothetical protein [Terracidiphilus sp.]